MEKSFKVSVYVFICMIDDYVAFKNQDTLAL